jgi:hypothetical protein
MKGKVFKKSKRVGTHYRRKVIADVKPKCMEYEPIIAPFQGFEPLFGS